MKKLYEPDYILWLMGKKGKLKATPKYTTKMNYIIRE